MFERSQRREDLIEAGPIARRASDAAVDHEMLRMLGDFGVEIVLQHAVCGFGNPVLAVQLRTTRGTHDAARIEARIGDGGAGH